MKPTLPLTLAVAFAAFLCAAGANAQTLEWARNMGGVDYDYPLDMVADADGNVFTTGVFRGTADFDPGPGVVNLTAAGERDVFVSKLDASGNFVWAKSVGSIDNEYGTDVDVDAAGNVFVVGVFLGTVDFDPGSGAYNMTSTTPGNFGNDAFVMKLDLDGNFLWAKQTQGYIVFGNTPILYVPEPKLAVDPSGNVFLGRSMNLAKLDAAGNFLWQDTLTTPGFGYMYIFGMRADAAGNLIISGELSGTVDFDPSAAVYNVTALLDFGSRDSYAAKYTPAGDLAWARAWGGGDDDYCRHIAVDATGNIYTIGYYYDTADMDPGPGVFNLVPDASTFSDIAYMSKLDADGNFITAHQLPYNVRPVGVAVTGNSTVFVTGNAFLTADFDPGSGVFNLSGSSSGKGFGFVSGFNASLLFDTAWAVNDTSSTGRLQPMSITAGGGSSVVVTGHFSKTVDFDSGTGTYPLSTPATNFDSTDVFVAQYAVSSGGGLTLNVSVSDTLACAADSCTADVDLTISGGNLPYLFVWSNANTAEDLADVCDGSYSVTVTDAAGNSAVASVTVTNAVQVCPATSAIDVSNVSWNAAQIGWPGNDCAVKYRVRLKNMNTGVTSMYFVLAPDTIKSFTGLAPNTLYKVRMRSQCSSNSSILSPWSAPVYFTTQSGTAAVCAPPTNLSATPTSNASATVNWTAIVGANGYQLRYRAQGTLGWTPVVINNGLATDATITGLQPNTTYQYQLRTKCSLTPLTWSTYSGVQTFSTPLRLGQDDANVVTAYPNPSTGTVHFDFGGLTGVLTVCNALGQAVVRTEIAGAHTAVSLPNGLLTYRFVTGNGTVYNGKVVVQR